MNNYQLEHGFDSGRCRHYLNGELTVLHCHHFTTLYSQLADDAQDMNGPKLLCDAAEETFHPILSKYFSEKNIQNLSDRVAVAEDYWKKVGMGVLRIINIGDFSATAEMPFSHVDEGWIKKWGNYNKPINFISQGFLCAAVAAILDKSVGSFTCTEIQSKVTGADKSVFSLVKK